MPTYYQLPETISFTNLDDEAVLLDLRTGSYFGLNHVGVKLINYLESGKSSQQAIIELAEYYGAELGVIESDVSKLINEMIERTLLIVTK